MVVLLISLVVVVVAIVVVIRLLLAELARTSAYRHSQAYSSQPTYSASVVNPAGAKGAVNVGAVRAGGVAVAAPPMEIDPIVPNGAVVVDSGPRPRQREVRRITKVVWWRRLRSGTALVLLVALLGVASAALVGAIALFIAFVLERAIS